MKYVFIGIIAVLFLKAGWGRLEKWLATRPEASSEKISSFSFNFDLSQTTPGQAIENLLGVGWANWILWTAAVVLIFVVIRSFYKPKRDNGLGWTVLAWIGAGVIAVILYATITTQTSKEVETFVEMDFRQAQIGHKETVRMGLHTIVVVKQRAALLERDGNVVFWPCPETVWPAKLPFVPRLEVVAGAGTTQNHLALTKQSREDLLANGTSAIDVQFTFGASLKNPCLNLQSK
jgi:hypothetical protein